MSKEVQNQLITDHFLFKEGDRFLQAANACRFWLNGRGIFHNKNKTFLVWVNEEDHLRIISMQLGGNVGQVLDRLIRGVKAIQSKVQFSRDDRLGWLTFCPTNLGTTIRASVHVKIPKVSARPDFKKLCEDMKLQPREEKPQNNSGQHSSSLQRSAGDEELMKLLNQPNNVNYCPGITTVELNRIPGVPLGLGIAGGVDKKCPPIISCLKAEGIAHKSDSLQIGDRLLSVNGFQMTSLTHDEILAFIRKLSDRIVITVEYNLNDLCFQKSPKPTVIKCFSVRLEPDETGCIGITLRGGVCHYDNTKTRPLTLSSIRARGPANSEGRLRVGDRIISINGEDVRGATHNEAYNLLKSSTDHRSTGVHLAVEYDVSVFEPSPNSHGVLNLEVEKESGIDLGVILKVIDTVGEKRVIIDDIIPASFADRCGAFNEGDEILSIDRNHLKHATMADIYQMLKDHGSPNGRLKLEIKPNYGPKSKRKFSKSIGGSKSQIFANPYDNCQQSRQTLNDSLADYAEIVKMGRNSSSKSPLTNGSLTTSFSSTNLPSGQVCHTEVMEVVLNSYNRGGYGILLHRFQQNSDDCNRTFMFVSYIERGSPADKSGILLIGDRILAINECGLENTSCDDANQFIRHCIGPLTLTVEFDVIETVLPGSGTFTIKLSNRGQNLGIIIQGGHSSKKGEAVVVSDIRTGSVAHRCGSIQISDQLLAIDNIPLDTCTVDEAVRLLQSSSDVVKIRVKKNLSQNDELEQLPKNVIYSVELSRKSGPLGITIAGVDDRLAPIFISQITKGGLADRTGALHVGDRILAINGQNLEESRVSEAIEVLQTAGDNVNLKISRNFSPSASTNGQRQLNGEKDSCDKLGTPVQSIDSAVESLEESPLNEGQQPSTSSHWNNGSQNLHNSNPMPKTISHQQAVNSMDDLTQQLSKSLTNYSDQRCQNKSPTAKKRGNEEHYVQLGGENCPCQGHCGHQSQEEWMRVLDALENVGEMEMLRKLEESIISGNVPCATEPSTPKAVVHDQSAFQCFSANFHDSNRPTSSASALFQPQAFNTVCQQHSEGHYCNNSPATLLQTSDTLATPSYNKTAGMSVSSSFHTSITAGESQIINLNQVIKFVLLKDVKFNDFGFSISEVENCSGVFINKIRVNGPAERAKIQPFDKLLSINDIDVRNSNCVATLQLISRAGNKLAVTACRDLNASNNDREGSSNFD